MAIWPVELPQQMELGESETPPDVMLRTKMDIGPDKIRRRFTAGVRMVRGFVEMSATNIASFDGFFVSTLKHGSIPFDWVLPRSGAAVTYRFVEVPQYESVADRKNWYRVKLSLEILP